MIWDLQGCWGNQWFKTSFNVLMQKGFIANIFLWVVLLKYKDEVIKSIKGFYAIYFKKLLPKWKG